MQCLLEHGTAVQHRCLVQVICHNLHDLSGDLNGSFVMAKALATGARDSQKALANLIASTPGLRRHMKSSQHGKYVYRLAFQMSDRHAKIPAPDIRMQTLSPAVQETTANSALPKAPQVGSVAYAKLHRHGGQGGDAVQVMFSKSA